MAVVVEQLSVRYKDLQAVDSISFAVNPGEIFGLIGPNGAGKTSTIECIEGLRRPSGGRIKVLGIDPSRRRELYTHIGVQLQETFYPPTIKVAELCQLFSSFYPAPLAYGELLAKFGLAGKARNRVSDLSGGESRKVSIILALLGNPQVLFFDELTTGLDPQSRKEMWQEIKSLRNEGKTVLMTTHYMEEAEYLCDRVCLLVAGRIAALGTVKELVAQTGQGQTIAFSTAEDVQALNELPGVDSFSREGPRVIIQGRSRDLLKEVVLWLAEHRVDFDDLSQTRNNLEDVFLKLAGKGEER